MAVEEYLKFGSWKFQKLVVRWSSMEIKDPSRRRRMGILVYHNHAHFSNDPPKTRGEFGPPVSSSPPRHLVMIIIAYLALWLLPSTTTHTREEKSRCWLVLKPSNNPICTDTRYYGPNVFVGGSCGRDLTLLVNIPK